MQLGRASSAAPRCVKGFAGMAVLVEGVKTWFNDPQLFNIRRLDAAVGSDGKIFVAYAGVSTFTFDGYIGVGQLNTTSDTLSTISGRTIDGQPESAPTTIDPVDLVSGPGGRMTALLSITSTSISADTNGALLVQRLSGASFDGDPVHVDPASTVNTIRNVDSAGVYDADGGLSVFYVDTVVNNGGGIQLARFRPDGTADGAPAVAVADRDLPGVFTTQANPGFVSATRMANGNYGLVWQEATPFNPPASAGSPRVVFQAVSASTGLAIGTALELDGTSAQQPEIITLAGGRMVVVWHDTSVNDQGIYKGQILSETGTKIGGVFEISSTHSVQETDLSLVALANGGFAVGWRDNVDASHLARIFNKDGVATGNDFDILSTDRDFSGADSALVAQGNLLYAMMGGINLTAGTGFVLQGQTWSTASSWGLTKTGGSRADRIAGTAKDDRIDGAKGNDVLSGVNGNDKLSGGLGADTLSGGNGRDEVIGGAGADRLTGGTGADSFVFAALADVGDTVTDFNTTQGDRLVFERDVFGDPVLTSAGAAPTTQQGLYFNTLTKELTYDPDGGGTAPRILVAVLQNVAGLTSEDWVFV